MEFVQFICEESYLHHEHYNEHNLLIYMLKLLNEKTPQLGINKSIYTEVTC